MRPHPLTHTVRDGGRGRTSRVCRHRQLSRPIQACAGRAAGQVQGQHRGFAVAGKWCAYVCVGGWVGGCGRGTFCDHGLLAIAGKQCAYVCVCATVCDHGLLASAGMWCAFVRVCVCVPQFVITGCSPLQACGALTSVCVCRSL